MELLLLTQIIIFFFTDLNERKMDKLTYHTPIHSPFPRFLRCLVRLSISSANQRQSTAKWSVNN